MHAAEGEAAAIQIKTAEETAAVIQVEATEEEKTATAIQVEATKVYERITQSSCLFAWFNNL